MHEYLKNRPLDISPESREDYLNAFHNQMNTLPSIKKTMKDIEEQLKNLEL